MNVKVISVAAALAVLPISAAAADPVDVTYTVTGSSGNWVLNFSVTNSIVNTQDIYFFGVKANGSIISYNGWGTDGNWGGYPDTWITGSPGPLDIEFGQTLSGFTVADHDLTEPTAIDWFAYSIATNFSTAPSSQWYEYNGSYNPGFSGTVTLSPVPGPTVGAGASSFALAGLFLGWRRRKRNAQAAA